MAVSLVISLVAAPLCVNLYKNKQRKREMAATQQVECISTKNSDWLMKAVHAERLSLRKQIEDDNK